MPASRRPSGNTPLPPLVDEEPIEQPAPSAAMIAWRDALAAQIYHFQRTFHTNMPSFQLPPLPDYQDSAISRRLSLLVPLRYATRAAVTHVDGETLDQPSSTQSRFWEIFSSASPPSTPPPPAYSELFPDTEVEKKRSMQTAIADAVADAKCAMVYDQVSEKASGVSAAISAVAKWPKRADRVSPLSWLWVSESACFTVAQRSVANWR